MKPVPDLPVTLRVGGRLSDITRQPLPPYAPEATAFLAALSKQLLALPEARQFPDIAAFAYWCRPASLARLQREFGAAHARLGRGLALHIAPANVPVNFAFSFAFGVLAGNANIVRIPDAGHPQVDVICDRIAALFDDPAHRRIAAMNRLIRYPRSDSITATLSQLCQARLIWGGDETVSRLRALPVHPRCVDIAFADRYSFCVLDSQAVLGASDTVLAALVKGFYDDVFLLDQNACSSPHLVLWHGTGQAEAAQGRFWSAMTDYLEKNYDLAPVHAVDKFVHLCATAIALPQARATRRHDNFVYRVRLDSLPADIERHRGRNGFFYEHAVDDLSCLGEIVEERYQTLTTFGIDRATLVQSIIAQGLSGIDRVVPVGKALDIGVIWDGYDLIGELSRIVHTA
ncbi:hypothetical protein BJF93_06455 [Xaviernesmea oryzae]|uniref:Acyl-CoA reductase n=1 Tax=Xaviernesmea oryzae TaxID=464029 RepID=A0A1Q9AS43_9HYPH|nr:acyl-CoA reductase [Xaviernesmea oryzae]OLP58254.1 hypothetical protein BJF93_06455 [Xaviernesmea oryzae]SEL44753.1 Acyl-CoA reductase (LuxC) [Xaviernesmea oryzae]